MNLRSNPASQPPKRAQHFWLLPLLLAGMLLSACTGTSEPRNPILLVTDFQNEAGSQVALTEDNFGATGASLDRFTFLEETVRPLPAPAVAYDVVGRTTTRSELVVLSRGTPQGGQAPAQLTFFRLSGLNADDPGAFVQTRQIDMSALTVVPALIDPTFCPTEVQITENGLYAATLNNPQACGGNVINASVDLIDLAGERLVERISGGVVPGGLALSQSPGQDLLYYALGLPGRLSVQEATMPRPGATFGPDDTIATREVAAINTDVRWGNLQDLSLIGGGAGSAPRLALLFEGGFVGVQGYAGAEPQVGTFVPTLPNNSQLIRDDTLQTAATLILSVPQERFSYFPPPQQGATPTGRDAFVTAVGAVTEPTYDFVYFVSNAQLSLFDLRSYRVGANLNLAPFALPELTQPSFITWVQAQPSPTLSP